MARNAGIALLMAGTLVLGACGSDDSDSLSFSDLGTAEVDSLYYMREEEKLARDVYLALYEIWATDIFSNIAASEQTHTDAVKALIEKYQLIDPAADNPPGVFTDPKFKVIYDDYLALGRQSRLSAITVGVTIEELDIHDIAGWLQVVQSTDIRAVYESLMCGSRNHLRSYYAELLAQGGSYTPQFITQAEFDAIVAAPMENCG
jgi:hypothetical protein